MLLWNPSQSHLFISKQLSRSIEVSLQEKKVLPVRNINRQITEPHSSFPRLCVLLARGRLVSSSSSSSIRKAEAKPSSNSQHSRTKLETKLLIQIPNIQVTRLESSASSSSIRKAESKPSSNSQHSRNKLETRLPVLSRSAKVDQVAHVNLLLLVILSPKVFLTGTCIHLQSSSKNIALTDGLRNMAHDRSSLIHNPLPLTLFFAY